MRTIGNAGSSARRVEAIASGTMSTGDTVIVNADGTVSVVTGSSQVESLGSPTVFYNVSAMEFFSNKASAYDSVNGKVVIAFQGQSSYGYAVVGDVSGNSISFGTPVAYSSVAAFWNSIDYDSNTGKFLITYLESGTTNDGVAVVGTVSGTSISFGTKSAFYNGAGQAARIKCAYNSTEQKFGIFYLDTADGKGKQVVATISGTSVSFGSTSLFYDGSMTVFDTCYDSHQNVFVTVYERNTGAYAVASTISGTSISSGSSSAVWTSADTASPDEFNWPAIAHDSENNINLCIFSSNKFTSKTITGTLTVGPEVEIEASVNAEYAGITYDPVAKKFVLAYKQGAGFYRTATISGSSAVFSSEAQFESDEVASGTTITSLQNGTVVISYEDEVNFDYGTSVVYQLQYENTNLTAENFIGFADYGVADGQAVVVNSRGAIAENQTGLTAGQKYYVQTNGTLSTTAGDPSVEAGTAVAADKIIVKG